MFKPSIKDGSRGRAEQPAWINSNPEFTKRQLFEFLNGTAYVREKTSQDVHHTISPQE